MEFLHTWGMIDRLEYLSRTLSRTRRKDYENYVINAIWHRLSPEVRGQLKPVSQQSVRTEDGRQFYIDLYFPQLNLAIECDERFHEHNQLADAQRQASIITELRPVEHPDLFTTLTAIQANECEFLRVPVPAPADAETSNAGRSPEAVTVAQIDATIDAHVAEITRRTATADFVMWDDLDIANDPNAFYAGRDEFTVGDGVSFATIAEICNVLLGCSYRGIQRSWFTPAGLAGTRGTDRDYSTYRIWCPKLVGTVSDSFHWQNSLASDGRTIYTHRGDGGAVEEISPDRVTKSLTFAQVRNPVTREIGYRFVGVFERAAGPAGVINGGTTEVHRRVGERFPKMPAADGTGEH